MKLNLKEASIGQSAIRVGCHRLTYFVLDYFEWTLRNRHSIYIISIHVDEASCKKFVP